MTFKDTVEAAQAYVTRGWSVVPLAPGSKAAYDPEWNKRAANYYTPNLFQANDNIGIRSVGGIVATDLDCGEAVALADFFLPDTTAVFGRGDRPRLKRFYTCTEISKTLAFKDQEAGTNLLELRANHQDMAPPSVHPNGELLLWSEFGEATPYSPEILLRAHRLLATACIVARYYGRPGERHEWTLALCGTFRQLGLSFEETERIIIHVAGYVEDAKVGDRLTEVRTTYAKADDEPLTGRKALKAISGTKILETLKRIWGSASTAFITNDKDAILANNQENIRRALAKLDVTLTFDTFAQKMMVRYNGYDGVLTDALVRRIWLTIDESFHFRPSREFFQEVIEDTAFCHKYHPVHDYLATLTWDGIPRVDGWIIESAKAADNEYTRAVSALVLIAAVRRVRLPGCKFDEIVVLESGTQGLLKSSALRALCPNETWFSDDLPLDVDAKQLIERTSGKWIIEASDLSGMRGAHAETLKGMLSRQVDGPVRLAYARIPVEQPRQFVILGTTNNYYYLGDSTGNRRFWPVRVEKFDVEYILKNRDQIWAEASVREANGESIRLPVHLYKHAEVQQDRRRNEDPWHEKIAHAFPKDKDQRLWPDEVWDVVGITVDRQDDRGQRRINLIMQALGYKKIAVRRGKDVKKGWARDATEGTPTLPGTEDPHEKPIVDGKVDEKEERL